MTDFINYSDIGFEAFQFVDKKQEVIARKKDIIDAVFDYYRLKPASILFVGFNPAVLGFSHLNVTVTKISDGCVQALQDQIPNIKHVPWDHLVTDGDRFDAVISVDEFLTFRSEEHTSELQSH